MSVLLRNGTLHRILCTIVNNTNIAKHERCFSVFQSKSIPQTNFLHNVIIQRSKSKKGKPRKEQSETETETESEEETLDRHTKLMNLNVPSMRLDTIVKSGLGMARNKIDAIFYDSKIRVNGEKVPKKSVAVHVGDEIDVVKGPSNTNPDLLIVARIEILKVVPKEESIGVKIKRCKSLLVDNYEK